MYSDDHRLRELDAQIKLKLEQGKVEEAEKLSTKLIEIAEGREPENAALSMVSRLFNSVVSKLPSKPSAEQIAQIKESAVTDERLRLLSLFHYVNAGLVAMFSSLFLVYAVMGIMIMVSSKMPHQVIAGASSASDAFMAGVFMLFFGLVPATIGWGYAGLNVWVGHCIKMRQRLNLCLVVSALNCLSVPTGTMLGVCSFMVLSSKPVKRIFGHEPFLLNG